jgi:hypothetical protein
LQQHALPDDSRNAGFEPDVTYADWKEHKSLLLVIPSLYRKPAAVQTPEHMSCESGKRRITARDGVLDGDWHTDVSSGNSSIVLM